MSERKCCYLQNGEAGGAACTADAEWELYGSNEPREPTDACTAHVGVMLDSSAETRVFPVRGRA